MRNDGLSRSAKCYIALVSTAGFLVALSTLVRADWRSERLFESIAYILMGALSSRLKVRLPGVRGTLSVNFIFILLGVVELHTVDALIISCIATLAQCVLASKAWPKPPQLLFNLGNAALCG